ncbi:MAG: acetate kinase, partial [Prevotellaceae bacterium]|nr:acetate kinase [Prevotellaceae bacterium]
VFTGGVGENDDLVRSGVCNNLDYLGVEFDNEVNKGARGKDMLISKPSSKVKIMAVATNEELVIAMDTLSIVSKLKQ